MGEGIDAFNRPSRTQMNFAFTWPGFETDANVGGGKTGYLVNPAGPGGEKVRQLGGQGVSVVSYSTKQKAALSTSSGSRNPTCRRSGGRLEDSPAFVRWSNPRFHQPASHMRKPS